MNEKYISASNLKSHYSWLGKDASLSPNDVDTIIDVQPAAEVEIVVRGEWVNNIRWNGCMVCNQCGFGIETKTQVYFDCNRKSDERECAICAGDIGLSYCPICGAHMVNK